MLSEEEVEDATISQLMCTEFFTKTAPQPSRSGVAVIETSFPENTLQGNHEIVLPPICEFSLPPWDSEELPLIHLRPVEIVTSLSSELVCGPKLSVVADVSLTAKPFSAIVTEINAPIENVGVSSRSNDGTLMKSVDNISRKRSHETTQTVLTLPTSLSTTREPLFDVFNLKPHADSVASRRKILEVTPEPSTNSMNSPNLDDLDDEDRPLTVDLSSELDIIHRNEQLLAQVNIPKVSTSRSSLVGFPSPEPRRPLKPCVSVSLSSCQVDRSKEIRRDSPCPNRLNQPIRPFVALAPNTLIRPDNSIDLDTYTHMSKFPSQSSTETVSLPTSIPSNENRQLSTSEVHLSTALVVPLSNSSFPTCLPLTSNNMLQFIPNNSHMSIRLQHSNLTLHSQPFAQFTHPAIQPSVSTPSIFSPPPQMFQQQHSSQPAVQIMPLLAAGSSPIPLSSLGISRSSTPFQLFNVPAQSQLLNTHGVLVPSLHGQPSGHSGFHFTTMNGQSNLFNPSASLFAPVSLPNFSPGIVSLSNGQAFIPCCPITGTGFAPQPSAVGLRISGMPVPAQDLLGLSSSVSEIESIKLHSRTHGELISPGIGTSATASSSSYFMQTSYNNNTTMETSFNGCASLGFSLAKQNSVTNSVSSSLFPIPSDVGLMDQSFSKFDLSSLHCLSTQNAPLQLNEDCVSELNGSSAGIQNSSFQQTYESWPSLQSLSVQHLPALISSPLLFGNPIYSTPMNSFSMPSTTTCVSCCSSEVNKIPPIQPSISTIYTCNDSFDAIGGPIYSFPIRRRWRPSMRKQCEDGVSISNYPTPLFLPSLTHESDSCILTTSTSSAPTLSTTALESYQARSLPTVDVDRVSACVEVASSTSCSRSECLDSDPPTLGNISSPSKSIFDNGSTLIQADSATGDSRITSPALVGHRAPISSFSKDGDSPNLLERQLSLQVLNSLPHGDCLSSVDSLSTVHLTSPSDISFGLNTEKLTPNTSEYPRSVSNCAHSSESVQLSAEVSDSSCSPIVISTVDSRTVRSPTSDCRIITHLIDGHVLYESNIPFPVRNAMALVEKVLHKRTSHENVCDSKGRYSKPSLSSSTVPSEKNQKTRSKFTTHHRSCLKTSPDIPTVTTNEDHTPYQGDISIFPPLTSKRDERKRKKEVSVISLPTNSNPVSLPSPIIPNARPSNGRLSPADIAVSYSSVQYKREPSSPQKIDKPYSVVCQLEGNNRISDETKPEILKFTIHPVHEPQLGERRHPKPCTIATPATTDNHQSHFTSCSTRPHTISCLTRSSDYVSCALPLFSLPSYTLPPTPSAPPGRIRHWTVTDVVSFVSSTPGCASYSQSFLNNEIDGEALLLLSENQFIQPPISMKIGPALKLAARLETLRCDTAYS